MAKEVDIIKTGRLTLRGIAEADAEDIVRWRSDSGVFRFFKSPHKLTLEEHINWYRNSYLSNDKRYDWLCIEDISNTPIGVFGLNIENNHAEVNYLLAPEAQHRGYAGEAVKALIQYAKESRGIHVITAEIHVDNHASRKLAEAIGFKLQKIENTFAYYDYEVNE